jgi:hypothetical protein
VQGRSDQVHATTFWIVAVLIAAGVVLVHKAASLTLPVPWGDEAFFIWQARAFERWNSFIAPELDASRPLLLLPFVYATVLGTAFKMFGFSRELARHLSLIFVLAGFGFLALAVRRLSAPVTSGSTTARQSDSPRTASSADSWPPPRQCPSPKREATPLFGSGSSGLGSWRFPRRWFGVGKLDSVELTWKPPPQAPTTPGTSPICAATSVVTRDQVPV